MRTDKTHKNDTLRTAALALLSKAELLQILNRLMEPQNVKAR